MKKKFHFSALKPYLLEIPLYALLVAGYLLLVLHLLYGRLKVLFDHHKVYYAFAALGLISIQGIVLDVLSSLLLKFIHPGSKWRPR